MIAAESCSTIAGLQFLLNFEDRAALRIATIPPIIGGHAKALTLTQQMLRYAEDQWLTEENRTKSFC